MIMFHIWSRNITFRHRLVWIMRYLMLFKFPHLGSGPDHESIREQFQPQFHPVSWPILKESMDSDQENTIYLYKDGCFF